MISSEALLEKQLLANEAKWRQLQDLYANEMGRAPSRDVPRTNRVLFSAVSDGDDDLRLQREFEEILQPIRPAPESLLPVPFRAATIAPGSGGARGPAAASLADLQRDERWFADDQLQPDSDDFVDILNNLRILSGQLPTAIRPSSRV